RRVGPRPVPCGGPLLRDPPRPRFFGVSSRSLACPAFRPACRAPLRRAVPRPVPCGGPLLRDPSRPRSLEVSLMALPARLSAWLPGRPADLFPGFAVSALIAATAQFLSEHYGAPAMLLALLLGLALNFL